MTVVVGLQRAALAALLLLAPLSLSAQGPTSAADTALWQRADRGRIQGSDAATVWVIVISDFQCPFCRRWHDETAPRIIQDYVRTGKVRIAYLNYPLSTHRNAWPAHEVAMCAAEQDKFWPLADAIFDRQNDWKSVSNAPAYFDSLARTLPVDHARLRSCVAAGRLRSLISSDFERSVRAGAGSTPTFFIGSQVLIGAQPYEAFARAIDEALAATPRAPN
jgi:protein-disulfide isomerase